MVKKSILICFILFLCWNVLLLFYFKDIVSSQHQWQDNVIKGQKFIYHDSDTIQNVLVGSSLSCRLIWDSIPEIYDLSLNGLSLFDGLAILDNSIKIPQNIFIETNIVLRPPSEDYYNTLFSPIPYYLKKYISSFRDDKQPLAIIGNSFLIPLSGKIVSESKKVFSDEEVLNDIETAPHSSKANEPIKSARKSGSVELFDVNLKRAIGENSKEPSEEILKSRFALLSEKVKRLQSRGATIIFFELPQNNQLVNLPRAKKIRAEFHHYFSSESYDFIELPENYSEYITTDGSHLTNEEAEIYTAYFNAQRREIFFEEMEVK